MQRCTPAWSAWQISEQQSPPTSQTSPMGRHPLTYWQTITPVPGSAQAPVQHSWWPVHGSPAVWHCSSSGHVPSAPQTPLQQSPSSVHTSPPALQMEREMQRPSPSNVPQMPEQHAAFPLHASPIGVHCERALLQVPDSHWALQQSESKSQDSPTMEQITSCAQTPSTQPRVQHSVATWQASPTRPQLDEAQVPDPAESTSHRPEQHSADAAQASPSAVHRPVGPRHRPKSHRSVQHSSAASHGVPTAEQVSAVVTVLE